MSHISRVSFFYHFSIPALNLRGELEVIMENRFVKTAHFFLTSTLGTAPQGTRWNQDVRHAQDPTVKYSTFSSPDMRLLFIVLLLQLCQASGGERPIFHDAIHIHLFFEYILTLFGICIACERVDQTSCMTIRHNH